MLSIIYTLISLYLSWVIVSPHSFWGVVGMLILALILGFILPLIFAGLLILLAWLLNAISGGHHD
ncbi:hypothetical protein [Acinetobacter brisouii]|uniref:hypothetical protein n=1 Tax=Acinetobacter brisouii TaxID=396323 RepID=UPI00124E3AFD|nr:hypothetical protein [Acinetobacter brisouii]